MSTKGFFMFVGGAAFGIVTVLILLAIATYIFAPKIVPSSPCLLDSNCNVERVCCTWRCDSKNLSFWACPDQLCNLLGNETKPTKKCSCTNFTCGLEESG